MRTCQETDCPNPVVARGYCPSHYMKHRRLGTFTVEPRPTRLCTVEGCGEKHYIKGHCRLHHVRWKTSGSTDEPKRETESLPGEIWVEIPGFKGHYEASNEGRIRKVDTYYKSPTGKDVFCRGGILFGKPAGGLPYTYLTLSLDGRVYRRAVHRLVCEAFHGPAPEGKPIVRHLNDIPTDNSADNLRWGSQSENLLDSVRNGNNPNSNKTHCKRGHALEGENVYYQAKGDRVGRACKTCLVEIHGPRKNERQRRKRAEGRT